MKRKRNGIIGYGAVSKANILPRPSKYNNRFAVIIPQVPCCEKPCEMDFTTVLYFLGGQGILTAAFCKGQQRLGGIGNFLPQDSLQ